MNDLPEWIKSIRTDSTYWKDEDGTVYRIDINGIRRCKASGRGAS